MAGYLKSELFRASGLIASRFAEHFELVCKLNVHRSKLRNLHKRFNISSRICCAWVYVSRVKVIIKEGFTYIGLLTSISNLYVCLIYRLCS